MKQKKHLLNSHAMNYIQEVFAPALESNGFVHPVDSFFCWYRLKNNEIINSVSFFSSWANLPIIMEMGSGIHPLCIEPFYSRSVHTSDLPIDNVRLDKHQIIEKGEAGPIVFMPYSQSAQVYAPAAGDKGLFTFSEIFLRQMDSIDSTQEAYEYHKQKYCDRPYIDNDARFTAISTSFIDEVIIVDDEELIPYCKNRVEKILAIYENRQLGQKTVEFVNHTKLQYRMLFDGARKEYFEALEQRKRKVIRRLKNSGIDIIS